MCRFVIREMRVRAPPNTSEVIAATGKAVLIAFCTILFRGLFDAKTYDWSFYTLAILGIACVMLRGTEQDEEAVTYSPPRYAVPGPAARSGYAG